MPAPPAPHDVSLRRPAFRFGIALGLAFSLVAVIGLLVSSRVSAVGRFADRNLMVAIGLLILIPVCRFLTSPAQIFLSGVTAWIILTLAYSALDIYFPELGTRLGTFHMFMLGAVVFGVVATVAWVMNLVVGAWHLREEHALAARKRVL